MRRVIFLIGLIVLATGCASSSMSVNQGRAPTQAINTIAIAPGSGVMGDAIGLELFNLGVRVVDQNQAAAIVGRLDMSEFEVTTTQGYAALREKGVDAVLVSKVITADDGTPESASVRVTSTSDGALLAGVSWENGWGGMRGSIADRTMRDNTSDAAQEIAAELYERLGQ